MVSIEFKVIIREIVKIGLIMNKKRVRFIHNSINSINIRERIRDITGFFEIEIIEVITNERVIIMNKFLFIQVFILVNKVLFLVFKNFDKIIKFSFIFFKLSFIDITGFDHFINFIDIIVSIFNFSIFRGESRDSAKLE